MFRQVMDFLNLREDGTYVDATVGLGGHSEEILRRIGPGGRLIGTDRDEAALMMAAERLRDGRCTIKKAHFSGIHEALGGLKVDGILFDLGVSMMQLKQEQRGFSFLRDEPLDMRMDTAQELTAEKIVNSYPEKELRRILTEYGEERLSAKIARRIVSERPIRTTGELAGIAERAYGKRGRIHPATRTFQAIRIAVNRELDEIGEGLRAASDMLRQGGRLVIVSYHSLEDRVAKNFMKEAARQGVMRILTKKPLTPSLEEIRENPSSRSAKLRAGEKL